MLPPQTKLSACEAEVAVMLDQQAKLKFSLEKVEKEKTELATKLTLTEKKLADAESGAGASTSELTQVQQQLQEELQEERDRHADTRFDSLLSSLFSSSFFFFQLPATLFSQL
jgi:predicted  nucleic acid-binding Zn-ribbon protein